MWLVTEESASPLVDPETLDFEISDFSYALDHFLLGRGTVQVCTATMLDRAALTPDRQVLVLDERLAEAEGYAAPEPALSKKA